MAPETNDPEVGRAVRLARAPFHREGELHRERELHRGGEPSLRALAPGVSRGASSRSSLLALFLGVLLLGSSIPLHAADDDTPAEPAKARLVADVTELRPGLTFRLGVHFTMVEHWHIYWHSAREGGLGTEVLWNLPEGWTAGPVEWPLPRRYDLPGDLTAFGYDDAVLLVSEVTIPAEAEVPSGGKITLGADLSWLACKELCVIGQGKPTLELPFRGAGAKASPADVKTRALFDMARAQLPLDPTQFTGKVAMRFDRPAPGEPPTDWHIRVTWPENAKIPPIADRSLLPPGTPEDAPIRFLLFPFDVPGATMGLGRIEESGGEKHDGPEAGSSTTEFHFSLDVWDASEFDLAKIGAVITWEIAQSSSKDDAKRQRRGLRLVAPARDH